MSNEIHTQTPENESQPTKYEEMVAVARNMREVAAALRERNKYGDAEFADDIDETIEIVEQIKKVRELNPDDPVVSEQFIEGILGDFHGAVQVYSDSVRRAQELEQTSAADRYDALKNL